MRTNIEIEDELMAEAMKAAGTQTKRETVERALHALIQLQTQEQLRQLRGKLPWDGDLEAMRTTD
jgi:Arc/MetJ family transcription regulator